MKGVMETNTHSLSLPLFNVLWVLPWDSQSPLMLSVQVSLLRSPTQTEQGREGGRDLQGHMEDIQHILKWHQEMLILIEWSGQEYG